MRNLMIRTGLALGLLAGGFVTAGLVACSSTPGQPNPALQFACILDAAAPEAVAAGQVIATLSGADAADVQKAGVADAALHPLVVKACITALPGSTPVPGSVSPVSVAPVALGPPAPESS